MVPSLSHTPTTPSSPTLTVVPEDDIVSTIKHVFDDERKDDHCLEEKEEIDEYPSPPETETVVDTPPNERDEREDFSKDEDLLPLPAVAAARNRVPWSFCSRAQPLRQRIRQLVMEEIEPNRYPAQLLACCFMTGYLNSIGYTTAFIWPAFHTGNVVQMGDAAGRLIHAPSFRLADKLSLTSLLAFLLGAFIARIGNRLGHTTRLWLVLGTLLQTLFTMLAGICAWKGGQPVPASQAHPTWTNVLSFATVGFISLTLGLQGVMSMRMKSHFGMTILMTGFWCELMSDPKIFERRHIARDRKITSIAWVFLGAFVATALLQAIGPAGTLSVGAGMRLLMSAAWLVGPRKENQS